MSGARSASSGPQRARSTSTATRGCPRLTRTHAPRQDGSRAPACSSPSSSWAPSSRSSRAPTTPC
eukprot:13694637-Alexandrium_andersonii.AAC.1